MSASAEQLCQLRRFKGKDACGTAAMCGHCDMNPHQKQAKGDELGLCALAQSEKLVGAEEPSVLVRF